MAVTGFNGVDGREAVIVSETLERAWVLAVKRKDKINIKMAVKRIFFIKYSMA